MTDEIKLNIEESSKGFPYQSLILTLTSLLIIFFVTLSLFNIAPKDQNAPDWTFFLLFAGMALVLGIIFLFFVPNTYRIRLINDMIEISSRNKSDEVPLTKIIKIEPKTIFINSFLSSYSFYLIEFRDKTKFGKSVFFRTKGQSIFKSGKNFGEILKIEWIKKTHANTR